MTDTLGFFPDRNELRAHEALSLLGDDAAFLVDERGMLHGHNGRGGEMLTGPEGRLLIVRHGRLAFADGGEQARFRQALQQSFKVDGEFRATLNPDLVAIFRQPGLSASSVRLMAVALRKLRQEVELSVDDVRRVTGLTKNQARFAIAAMNGWTPESYAEAQGTKLRNVRYALYSATMRLGLAGRVELVRFMLRTFC